ncbi:MAG: AMP-binding protein [Hydrogenophaga sp.]|uniref:AMP-binding protein n=1 Tax=Hydrogenophaga sp. TaxID=1904254 RepID=UPI001D3B3143|nr:AMP-binding protein [Hydrogenophaga sp.]MBX3609646.1 AMP-binding protein [Hydrogenophaga sp.]
MNSMVVQTASAAWRAADWQQQVDAAAGLLQRTGVRVLASLLDNGAAFIALDEAALATQTVHVPLPPFFTPAQTQHALRAAGVDLLVASPALSALWPQLTWTHQQLAGEPVSVATIDADPVPMPAGTAKLTFTSGTTGQPKGVCLGGDALRAVANGLVQVLGPLGIERHLSVLPYAVLLENVAGTMAARQQGATVISLPSQAVGLSGSSQFDPAVFDLAIRSYEANSVILLPQMLRAWVAYLAMSGQRASDSLKFVAVGGAAVGATLLAQAHALGIPAYEGYGLSEGASVQTLNLPGASRAGCAGRALPHAQLRVSDDGEIEVRGSLMLGYLGDPTPVPEWWPSGDLGHIDADGFLHIDGRRKHVLITSYGRNVSPEWVETVLTSQPAIAMAVVMGDGQPALSAVIWPSPLARSLPQGGVAQAVAQANAQLPDYARIDRWVVSDLARDMARGLFTANGRPVRDRMLAVHGPCLCSPLADPAPTA